MKKLNLLFVLVFCILTLALPGCGDSDDETSNAVEAVFAWAEGILDTDFDTDGIRVDDHGGGNDDIAFGVAFQTLSPEKIIIVGTANDDVMLARYNQDGTLDTSFDTDGVRTDDVLGGLEHFSDVKVQTDGKIVAVGESDSGGTSWDYLVARYNTDGTPDISFDADGFRTDDAGFGSANGLSAVAIQADSKIVAVGSAFSATDRDVVVARYNTNGSPDTSFGTGGFIMVDIAGDDDSGRDVAIQPDGKIVVAGQAFFTGLGVRAVVLRFNTDGSLDTTFDADGIVITLVGISNEAQGLALQPDGKIITAGPYSAPLAVRPIFVARYNTDGSLDTSFNFDGIVTAQVGAIDDWVGDLALQSDGRIVVAGNSEHAVTADDFMAARFLTDGSLDTSFGIGGFVTTDIVSGIGIDDWGRAVGIQSNGRIVVVGFTNPGANIDTAIVRYK